MPAKQALISVTMPEYWDLACAELSGRCEIMKSLIESYQGEATLTSRGDAFFTLVRSITGQQISVKAADAVWGRVMIAAGTMKPENILALSDEQLRACGLSGSKIKYVRGLAEHFAAHPTSGEDWMALPEEEAVAAMVALKGVGRWTAEMMLIFHHLRPDVWPLGDVGLVNALTKHYGKGKPLSEAALKRVSKKLSPWRSVATWYLWRSLDPEPISY